MKMNMNKGRRLLNPFRDYIMMFPIEEGTHLKEGDFVVVNPETNIASLPQKQGGYFSVGRVIKIVMTEEGTPMVICKDGMYMCCNTKNEKFMVTEQDCNCGRVCYFEDDNTVTLDDENTTEAGFIIGVTEDQVIIKIYPNKGKN